MIASGQKISAEDVICAARSWVGVPYRHQSRSRTRGVDCIQFVFAVAEQLGVATPAIEMTYRMLNNPNRVRALLTKFGEPVEREQLGAVAFWGARQHLPTHFGFFSSLEGKPALIHADAQLGRVVEHNIPDSQLVLIDSFWRLK